MGLGVGISAVLALGGGPRGVRVRRIGARRRGSRRLLGGRRLRRYGRRGRRRSSRRGSSRCRSRRRRCGSRGCGCCRSYCAAALVDTAMTTAGTLAALGTGAVLTGDGRNRSICAGCGRGGCGSRRCCAGTRSTTTLVDAAMTAAGTLAALGACAILAGDGGCRGIGTGRRGRCCRRGRSAGAGRAGALVDTTMTTAGPFAALGTRAVLAGDGRGRGIGVNRRRHHGGGGKQDGSQNEMQCVSHGRLPSVGSGLLRVTFILVALAVIMLRVRCRFNVRRARPGIFRRSCTTRTPRWESACAGLAGAVLHGICTNRAPIRQGAGLQCLACPCRDRTERRPVAASPW